MFRNRIKFLLKEAKDGESTTVKGWVKSKRVSKKFAFVVINDGSMQQDLQIIVDTGSEAFGALDHVSTGAAVQIDGVFRESPGKGQDWELHADRMAVLGQSSATEYPLQKKGHTLEFLRDIGHIRGRTNTFGAVFRVRNTLSCLIHEFFQNQGFIWAHTPIITANDCEGAGELFQVTTMDLEKLAGSQKKPDFSQDFFGKPAHLTVSGQLNGEAMALSVGDIYTFGPTFRAENSNTTRHLSEFWMVEPEMAFADLRDDAILAEEFLKFIFGEVVKRCPEELKFLDKLYPDCDVGNLQALSRQPFQRMSYTQAVEELQNSSKKFEFPVEWGADLQTEHERYLTEEVVKGPLIVTDYPREIKAFYMKLNADEKTVAAMDVLLPRIGEIIGGSQREDDLAVLQRRLDEEQIPTENLQWYLDLRRFGGCPHAGFGLGFERLVQFVTGMGNIRDTIPFPRTPQSVPF